MFLFCFTKILNQAFNMTHTFEFEVSLHFCMLWPTVWHVIMHRIWMSSSRHRAIFSWWYRVILSWRHAPIMTCRHVSIQARWYRGASWGRPGTVPSRWSRPIVDPNGIPYHCNMIALLFLGQLSIIVLIHFIKDCFVIGLKFQQSS